MASQPAITFAAAVEPSFQDAADKLTMADLRALYDAMHGVVRALFGVVNEPRIWSGEGHTPAGTIIRDMSEEAGWRMQACVDAARRRTVVESSDRDHRAYIVLHSAISNGEDATEITAIAASLAASRH